VIRRGVCCTCTRCTAAADEIALHSACAQQSLNCSPNQRVKLDQDILPSLMELLVAPNALLLHKSETAAPLFCSLHALWQAASLCDNRTDYTLKKTRECCPARPHQDCLMGGRPPRTFKNLTMAALTCSKKLHEISNAKESECRVRRELVAAAPLHFRGAAPWISPGWRINFAMKAPLDFWLGLVD